jgi:two-component system, cell cycle sensor histidine kinase and response regulator CckA
MSWPGLLQALPWALLIPMGLAFLAPFAVAAAQFRGRTGATVARRVSWLVAFQASIGLALLVLATAVAVFRVGLSQLSAPTPDALVAIAADMERVRLATGGDEASLNGRLALLDAGDTRIVWSLIGRRGCTGTGCVLARSPGIRPGAAEVALDAAQPRSGPGAWPLELEGRVAMVVPVPLRDHEGSPDALLLIALDANPVVRQARVATWGMLGFAAALWILLVAGTRRAVALSVGDRLRALAQSIANPSAQGSLPHGGTTSGEDELQALARAVELAGERAVRQQIQFRTLIDHVPVGIARLDPRGSVVAANPRFRELLRLPPAEAIPPWSSIFVDPGEQEVLARVAAGSGEVSNTFWSWRDTEGATHVVRASVVSLPHGTPDSGAVLLVEDVSEQRALEAQLLRAQKMEVVGQLAGGIAHDFNNLLTVVRANVAVLGGVTGSPELGAIDDAAARGGRLVRRLMTISRNDVLAATPQPLGPILFETVAMVRRVLPARIRVEAPVEVPPVTVRIDQDAVQQALLNLALNARDAIAGEGTIRFQAREEMDADGVRMLRVAVSDNGMGMPPEVLNRATEPFFTTKGPDAGTGLGLSMVYSIMQRLGGRLELRSSPGRGTRVDLWFPLSGEPAAPSLILPADPVQDRSAGSRILLVEDEHAVRVATERTLVRLGYTVTSVASARAALQALEEDPALELVVTDVMMPGGTGIDLLREARKRGVDLPFLFVSGYAMESLEGILESDSSTAMLTKPWTVEELQDGVRSMTRQPEGRGGSQVQGL